MTPTSTAATGTKAPEPPQIPAGQEVFDVIMEHIEPDLTSKGLQKLDEKYVDEKPEETAARQKRYDLAFEKYDQAFDGYMATLHTQVARFRKESFQYAEMKQRTRESDALKTIDTSFLQSA